MVDKTLPAKLYVVALVKALMINLLSKKVAPYVDQNGLHRAVELESPAGIRALDKCY